MKKHLGSTIALILGVLTFVSGVTRPGSLLIAGPIIIAGALAYRSAKKRRLGEAKNTLLRKGFETIAIVAIITAVVLQKNLAEKMYTDPVPNLFIPLWAIIAYSIIVLKKSKCVKKVGDVNKHD